MSPTENIHKQTKPNFLRGYLNQDFAMLQKPKNKIKLLESEAEKLVLLKKYQRRGEMRKLKRSFIKSRKKKKRIKIKKHCK